MKYVDDRPINKRIDYNLIKLCDFMKSLLHKNRKGKEMRPSAKELLSFLFKWFNEVNDGIYKKTNIYEY